jgi:hypothetical protein
MSIAESPGDARHGAPDRPSALASAVLFAMLFCFYLAPAFFSHLMIQGEESSGLFEFFDLTLFYPGQNRILSVEPALASLAPTLWASFVFITLYKIALVTTSTYLIIKFSKICAFYLSLATLFVLFMLFSHWGYAYNFSTVQPYVSPLCGFVIASKILLPRRRRVVSMAASVFFAAIILFAAVGVNPIIGIFGCFLLALLFIDEARIARVGIAYACRPPPWGWSMMRLILTRNAMILVMIAILAGSSAFFVWFQTHYEKLYPASVASNYSISGYATFHPSIGNITTSIKYMAVYFSMGFHWPLTARGFLVTLIILPILQIALLWKFRNQPHYDSLSNLVRLALIVYLASLCTICVVAQVSHVLLVDNFIRGRYFTIPYLSCAAALIVTLAAVLRYVADGTRRWWPQRHRLLDHRSVTAAACVMALATTVTILSHLAAGERPIFEPLHAPRGSAEAQAQAGLAETIRSSGVKAIIGSYWVVWDLGFDLNRRQPSDRPVVTPVTIRTEAFSLAAFKPVIEQLNADGGIDFACIETPGPTDAADVPCADVKTYQQHGAFPVGNITQVRRERLGAYGISFYRLAAAPAHSGPCAPGDIVFRAEQNAQSDDLHSHYAVRKNGFVYMTGETYRDRPVNITVDTGRRHFSFDSSVGSQSDIMLDGQHLHVNRNRACTLFIAREGSNSMGYDSWSITLNPVAPYPLAADLCQDTISADQPMRFVLAPVSAPACRAGRYLQRGWWANEATGTWTIDRTASLVLPIAGLPPGDLQLVFDASSYAGMGFYNAPQTVNVAVNGHPAAAWHFAPQFRFATPIIVPAKDWVGADAITITFQIDPPYQPKLLGTAPDTRNLGLFLRGLVVHAIPK